MRIGPNLYYKCPSCDNIIKNRSILSGNTFGATHYSDGRINAQMLPSIPNLTKCVKCNAILWLYDLKEIGEAYRSESVKPEWLEADKAEHLELYDLWRALQSLPEYCGKLFVFEQVVEDEEADRDEEEGYEDDDEEFMPTEREIYIRRHIWWKYNDIKSKTPAETELWRLNCIDLLSLLDVETNDNMRAMAAELNRNLGNFSECLELIRDLPEKRYARFRERITEECEKGNTQTVILNAK